MDDEQLMKIVKKNSMKFKLLISDKIFNINQVKCYQNENPVDKPTTRGGVYFADIKEMKVEATITDTDISKHLADAMLGPNKTFLDIIIEAQIKDGERISLITNLTNTMQNSSKMLLYLTVKNAIIKSD